MSALWHQARCERSDEDVQLQDFGRFSIKTIKAHNAINPRTKEHVWVPEKKKIIFLLTPHFKFNEAETVEEISDIPQEKEYGGTLAYTQNKTRRTN